MAYVYKLHHDVSILHCRFTGEVSLRVILDLLDKLSADPVYSGGIDVIADFLRITHVEVDRSNQRRLFARMETLSDAQALPRSCALLVQGEPLWSFAGMLAEQTTLQSPLVFERFRTPGDALTFVGLDPRRQSERFGYLPTL